MFRPFFQKSVNTEIKPTTDFAFFTGKLTTNLHDRCFVFTDVEVGL